jgi:hypothetical protein
MHPVHQHLELEGIAPSIGTVGDAYPNALMESPDPPTAQETR